MSAHGRTLLAAEAGLALVTAAAIIGMHRLFADGSYRPVLLAQALAAHVVVAVLRRWGVALPVSAVATAVAAALVLTWTHYLDLTVAFLPGRDVLAAAGDDLRAAWALFQDVKAPAPVETGFMLAAGAAVWAMVFVADWAAFRASATFEALLPSATLFLFAAALGAPGGRVPGAALYAATAMGFVLLQRTLTQEQSSAWAATHRSRGRWSLIGTGAGLILVAVAAGVVAGPKLPGAGADPVLAWRDLNDDDPARVVVSPMVDIQARMLDQPDVELFTVRSPRPEYWRLTSLDEFDGTIWRSSYGTNDADGELPQDFEAGVETATIEQTVTVSRLAAVWLPAAYEPRSIVPGENEVDWDPRSSTLIVDGQLRTSDGISYQVTSQVPEWTEAELSSAGSEVPDDIAQTYRQLPSDLSPRVTALADDITDGIGSPYGKARAIADHLRGNFTYDIDAPAGHGNDALTNFLFTTRRGYCEQFAGAFGALARSIGLPTRVAVGFTSGIPDPGDPNLFHVTGRHAHAWNEVYLDGYGWVTFDPTPGRAPPQSEEWLGVPAQQDNAGGAGSPTATAAALIPAPGSIPAPTGDPRTGPGPDRNELAVSDGVEDDGGSGVAAALRTAGFSALALAAAYVLVVPVALAIQAAVRRRRAAEPVAHVRWAWRDAVERATGAGAELPTSLTVAETARGLAAALPEVAPVVPGLAATVERVAYAEAEPTPDELGEVDRARRQIAAAAARRVGVPLRVARALDLRVLWRRAWSGQRRSAHTTTPVVLPR
jgi:transglutaminase-like putative cysteine protease